MTTTNIIRLSVASSALTPGLPVTIRPIPTNDEVLTYEGIRAETPCFNEWTLIVVLEGKGNFFSTRKTLRHGFVSTGQTSARHNPIPQGETHWDSDLLVCDAEEILKRSVVEPARENSWETWKYFMASVPEPGLCSEKEAKSLLRIASESLDQKLPGETGSAN